MTFEVIRSALLWCSVINVGLLLYSFLMFITAHGWIYRIHSKWYHISPEQFDTIWYGLMGGYKICIFVFNIVPLLALYIVG